MTENERSFRIGPPVHEKGPLVYGDYDQVELDAAYDQAMYAPFRDQIVRRFTAASEAAIERLGAPERHRYGSTSFEYIDIFRAKQAKAPIFVFVHGGSWKTSPALRFAYIAEMLVAAGVHCALVEFAGVETVRGRLLTLAEQLRGAIEWLYDHAMGFGGDADRLVLGGHSSGGHLAGTLLTTDWPSFGRPKDLIKGAVLCSGMYDLFPVSLSKRSAFVAFDDETLEALSPIRHIDRITAPITLAYGTEETPEFQRQARDFAAALRAGGKVAELAVGIGYNHFDIMESLGSPFGILGRAVMQHCRPG
ncbi:MAG TPA: alpha/beta hydrolase [Candidatus Aquilonibacter sp.]